MEGRKEGRKKGRKLNGAGDCWSDGLVFFPFIASEIVAGLTSPVIMFA